MSQHDGMFGKDVERMNGSKNNNNKATHHTVRLYATEHIISTIYTPAL